MAEKGFGVKEVNLIGASGTPTITSPNNLNLNANNVAISTNVSIGGTLSVTGNVSVGGTLTYEDVTNIDSVGIVTARTGVVTPNVDVDDFISVGSNLHLGNAGVVTATSFSGGSLQATTGTFSGNISGNQGAFGGNISGPLLNITGDTGDDGIILINSAGGTNSDFSRIRQVISDDSFRIENKASGSYQSILKGTSDRVIELHYQGAKKLETTNTGIDVTGAITVNGSALSITPTNSDIQVVYAVTSNGSSAYRFAGNGVVSTADNPDLYLIRGQKYRFINNSGGSHPFQIRESSGGTAYSTGVTNNGAASGNIDFAPTFDSPAQLVYQCTVHGGMVGNIYLRDAAGTNTNVGVTTFSGSVTVGYDTTYSPIQQASNTYYYTRFDQATSVSGSNIVNLATGSLKSSETIPVHNMTRQSDAGAHSLYNSSTTSGSVSRDMSSADPFAPKSYGLTMGTMFYSHTSGNNGSGVIHYGATSTGEHFFVRYKYNSNSILVGVDTDGSDNWSTAYQNDLMSDSNWYFLVVAVERNGTLLTSLNGAPLTPIRIIGTAPEPGNARFGLAGDAYGDNNSRHRYATAFWHRGVISNELIAQEYAWLKTIWTGASLP